MDMDMLLKMPCRHASQRRELFGRGRSSVASFPSVVVEEEEEEGIVTAWRQVDLNWNRSWVASKQDRSSELSGRGRT